jgi:ABC-2 type transport system permease protein
MIAALIQKDLKLYFRNRFFALITALGLVAYLVIYFLAPDTTEQDLGLAIWMETPAQAAMESPLEALGNIEQYPTEADLTRAVEEGRHVAGLVLTERDLAALQQREPRRLRLLFAPGTPAEVQTSYSSVLTIALNDALAGGGLATRVRGQEEVLGPELLGAGLSLRQRLLPMLLLMILVVEVMGLATLIAEERARGTAQALLVTPLSLSGFFTSKTIMGVGMAFTQVLLLVLLTGQIVKSPALILVTLLLGSLFVTGLSFLIASVARDMMGVIAWSMMLLVVLAIPAFTILFPGTATAWVDAIPTFYLVDTLHRVINFDAAWSDVARNLWILAASGALALVLGSTALRRRFQ